VDPISYTVRRSDRAKRVRVTVDPAGGVQVVVPAAARSADRAASAAIAQLRPWIERRQAELARVRTAVAARGNTVPYLGAELTVREQPGRTRVHRHGGVLLTPAGEERVPALERWYRRAARDEIAPRLDRAVFVANTRYTALTIRGQKTRWGSCSSKGAMSFNWRLLLAPEPVLDYVIWHEVCHLEVMDHSPRFWALLASRWPQYGEHRRWLRAHGATLVLT
jgi:predicted metal-dependent hydrolase